MGRVLPIVQGWRLTPAHRPMAGKIYVGPVEILSGPLKFPITAIQIMVFGSRLWDFGVVGPVEKKVSFHACSLKLYMSPLLCTAYLL